METVHGVAQEIWSRQSSIVGEEGGEGETERDGIIGKRHALTTRRSLGGWMCDRASGE